MHKVNDENSMRAWIDGHLDVTTGTMSEQVVRQWRRLRMRDESIIYRLALYGFVTRRRRDGNADAYPEAEFADFCGQFAIKFNWILLGKGQVVAMPMFARVGRQTIIRIQNVIGRSHTIESAVIRKTFI
jgi:hypothetical protein